MHRKLILLVEDDQNEIDLTIRALRKSNINNQVVVMHDGAEALDYLFGSGAKESPGSDVQVTLLDLNLPKVHGLEVLRQMRADDRTRTVPIVVLTSSDERQDMIRAYELGANSYICKPVNFDMFVESVRQVGQYWLNLNDVPSSDTAGL